MENGVRALREALGLTQQEFAGRIGRKYSSVQGYEGGRRPPPEVVEKLRVLAKENGLSSIALMLDGDEPHMPARSASPDTGILMALRPEQKGESPEDDRHDWHALLDYILDFGSESTVATTKGNLSIAAGLTRAPSPKRRTARPK